MPAKIPTGVATSTDKPTINKLPTMALRKPPPSVPGAGVSLVKMFQSNAAKPLVNKTTKIQSNTDKPKAMASMEVAIPQALARRRLRYSA